MNHVAQVVLGAIRSQICGQQFHIDGELSEELLKKVYAFSKQQDMVHIVATELFAQNVFGEQEEINAFKKQQLTAFYRYERIQREQQAVCRVLEECGVPYMPLKGAVMRQYYAEPWMRTSSDIDILVPKKDVKVAAEALVRVLNYENRGALEHDVQMFAPNGVHLELHFETIEDYHLEKANKVLENIWEEHAICIGGNHYAMSNEIFYFYHVAHMAKHFAQGGCGIRFFLDMWLLNHKMDFDAQKKKALLQAGDLLDFSEHAEHLSEVWFGSAEHTEVTERMERHVLGGGVFGSSDGARVVKSVRRGGKLGYAMYLVFRPLNELRRTYTILYKHKWLYPFCQIHRWFSLLFRGGISNVRGILRKGADAYEQNGDSVDQMLRDLKLLKR